MEFQNTSPFNQQDQRITVSHESTHDILEETLPKYTYEPLQGPEFVRIFSLHPNKDRIECSLKQVNVSSGRYQALSYVWGSEDRPFRAVVLDTQGKAIGYISLTENLRNAICDLRDSSEFPNKVFWIDQISIDQGGEEKSHQVKLMGKIFQSATRVILYTGPAGPNSDEELVGLNLMSRLFEHFAPNYDKMFEDSEGSLAFAATRYSALPVQQVPADIFMINQKDYVQRGWRWICQVSLGEWTQRLWMVQEQLLNPEIVMMRGMQMLSWEMVVMTNIFFSLQLLPTKCLELFWKEEKPKVSHRTYDSIATSLFAMWWNRRWMLQSGKFDILHGSLLYNLQLYAQRRCRDPRDRIYALLSISKDAKWVSIQPDYSQSIMSVYLNASIRLLETSHDLTWLFLSCCWTVHKEVEENYPSWALRPPPKDFDLARFALPANVQLLHLRATSRITPSYNPETSVLVTHGCILDSIAAPASPILLSYSFFHGLADAASMRDRLRLMSAWEKLLRYQSSHITLQRAASLCRALATHDLFWNPAQHPTRGTNQQLVYYLWCEVRNLVLEIQHMASVLGVQVDDELRPLYSVIEEMAGLLAPSINVQHFRPTDQLSQEDFETCLTFRSNSLLHGRSVAITNNGHVCNAMNEVKQGDVVAILQGADRLFILRPVNKQYRVVGDAHIYELMNGKTYEGLDPDVADQEIELI